MSPYINLDLKVLMDLLVIYTQQYDKMVSTKVYSVEEFTQCRQKLAEIHTAIKAKVEDPDHSMINILPAFPLHHPASKDPGTDSSKENPDRS